MRKPNLFLLTHKNVSKAQRMISITAGALLVYNALKEKKKPLQALTGAYFLFRGTTGYCPLTEAFRAKEESVEVAVSLTVNKPLAETYQFWRKLSSLPLFMKHLKSVTELDNKRSVWVTRLPWKIGKLEWEAEIIAEEENKLIAWQSLENAALENSGIVHFKDAGKFGTEIQVRIYYAAPGGKPGKLAAQLIKPAFQELITEDIKNFRRYMETGEIPTTDGQPSNH